MKKIKIKYKCLNCGFPSDVKVNYCKNCFDEKYFDKVFFYFYYKTPIDGIIKNMKFNNNIRSVYLLRRICKYLSLPEPLKYDIITMVPSHWKRRFIRLFHPADIMTKEISKLHNITLIKPAVRKRKTTYQWQLKYKERFRNIKGAFNLVRDVRNKNILLVDDIYTSGATVNELSKLFKYSGAKIVDCFILSIPEKLG
ncbi:MAG: ComF family protein [Deferribacterota bacterium]|nr:ComF family protein [Deferribacterota bacterium]